MTITANPEIITANATLDTGYDTYLIDASGGSITITLPDITNITGLVFILKRTDTTANLVVVTGQSGQTIDNQTIISIPINTGITISSLNNVWYIIFGHPAPNNSFVTLTSNATTTSPTFTPFLTMTMNATGNRSFLINASFSSSNTSPTLETNSFAIFVDGSSTPTLGAASSVSSGQIQSGSIIYKTGVLAPGTYTISLEWMTTGGTAQILAATEPSSYHASLSATEVN